MYEVIVIEESLQKSLEIKEIVFENERIFTVDTEGCAESFGIEKERKICITKSSTGECVFLSDGEKIIIEFKEFLEKIIETAIIEKETGEALKTFNMVVDKYNLMTQTLKNAEINLEALSKTISENYALLLEEAKNKDEIIALSVKVTE